MSLKTLHQVIIFAGITISLIFAFWCFTSPDAAGSTGYFIAGIASVFAAFALVGYEFYFLKKTRRLIIH
ncbi:MAG: hypothetical protein LV481_01165 [Methylacidiphilales bacterium]|nr:hypothetical protein [Candidatus Methylacidiphilales bacterium]